jgi:DNA-binding CsgD family transcriptional regulator
MTVDVFANHSSHAVGSHRSYDPGDSHWLSAPEQLYVVRAIGICASIRTVEEYSAWLSEDLDSLLHHRGWACGLGSLQAEAYTATHWLASRGLNDQLPTVQIMSKTVVCPLLTSWLKSRRPQVYVRAPDQDNDRLAGNLFAPGQLDNAVVHCQMDPGNKWTSLFSFNNLVERPGYRQRLLLDLLVPQMHATFCRVVAELMRTHDRSTGASAKLTSRELKILHYISLGRTNAEIAKLMHKSVFTVNNQVVRVLAKLTAKNRTQAVVVAREMGLLTP